MATPWFDDMAGEDITLRQSHRCRLGLWFLAMAGISLCDQFVKLKRSGNQCGFFWPWCMRSSFFSSSSFPILMFLYWASLRLLINDTANPLFSEFASSDRSFGKGASNHLSLPRYFTATMGAKNPLFIRCNYLPTLSKCILSFRELEWQLYITLRESHQCRLGFWFLAMACILRSQDVWASVSNFVDFCIKLHASTDGARCVHGKNSKHVSSIQEAFASGPHWSSQLWSWPHSKVLVIILIYIPTLLIVQNDTQKCVFIHWCIPAVWANVIRHSLHIWQQQGLQILRMTMNITVLDNFLVWDVCICSNLQLMILWVAKVHHQLHSPPINWMYFDFLDLML